MYYQSTRGHQDKITGSQAVIKGMSEDGGLFVPQKFPQLSWENVRGKAYPELVKIILSLYFPEFTEDQLNRIVRHYNKKFTKKNCTGSIIWEAIIFGIISRADSFI